METNTEFVKKLFYSQIRKLTMNTCGIETFDIQFSDRWLGGDSYERKRHLH